MSSPAAVAFGLGTSAAWGCGDFLGGFSTKKAHVAWVSLLGGTVAIPLLVTLALVLREPFPAHASLAWALLAGCSGGAGLLTFYQALSRSHMGLVAPVTAVTFAGLPVVATAYLQTAPTPGQAAGFALALGGLALVSWRRGAGALDVRSATLAVAAGICFAGFAFLLSLSGSGGYVWCLAAAKVSSVAIALAWLAVLRPPPTGLRAAASTSVVAGALDATGNAFLLAGSMLGRLDVTVVLASFYPAVTVALAWSVLRERLGIAQAAGAALLVLAVPLVAS